MKKRVIEPKMATGIENIFSMPGAVFSNRFIYARSLRLSRSLAQKLNNNPNGRDDEHQPWDYCKDESD